MLSKKYKMKKRWQTGRATKHQKHVSKMNLDYLEMERKTLPVDIWTATESWCNWKLMQLHPLHIWGLVSQQLQIWMKQMKLELWELLMGIFHYFLTISKLLISLLVAPELAVKVWRWTASCFAKTHFPRAAWVEIQMVEKLSQQVALVRRGPGETAGLPPSPPFMWALCGFGPVVEALWSDGLNRPISKPTLVGRCWPPGARPHSASPLTLSETLRVSPVSKATGLRVEEAGGNST